MFVKNGKLLLLLSVVVFGAGAIWVLAVWISFFTGNAPEYDGGGGSVLKTMMGLITMVLGVFLYHEYREMKKECNGTVLSKTIR